MIASGRNRTWVVLGGFVSVLFGCDGQNGFVDSGPPSVEDARFIEVTPEYLSIAMAGDTSRLTVTVRDAKGRRLDGLPVIWTNTNPHVAAVNAGGEIIGLDRGAAVVRASVGSVTDSAVVTVVATKYPPRPTRIELIPREDTIAAVGESVQLNAFGYDEAGERFGGPSVAWFSLDPRVASVDALGRVTGRAKGLARVLITNGNVSDTALVAVNPTVPVVDVVLTPALDTIYGVPETLKLTAIAVDAGATQSPAKPLRCPA
jgi:uncharacterized protein YjdB